jgi:hypothetical protein
MSSIVAYELTGTSLLDFKFTFSESDCNSTRFGGLEMRQMKKDALWVLLGTI